MWSAIKRLGRRRNEARARIEPSIWAGLMRELPLLEGLSAGEQSRLRDLATAFLSSKTLEPVSPEIDLSPRIRALLGLQACLPILELGIEWYAGFHSVVIYPGDFAPEREHIDEAGVVHRIREELRGEAWDRGPVILSLEDLLEPAAEEGENLIIHEFAHKLDLQNGSANGMPPLHRGMRPESWTEALSGAFAELNEDLSIGESTTVDPYAATDPAEFFAVLSEAFFAAPWIPATAYPRVYEQLKAFYRQDPLARLASVHD